MNLYRLENLFILEKKTEISVIKFPGIAIVFGAFKNVEFNKSTDIVIPVTFKTASISTIPHHTGTTGILTTMAYAAGNTITIRINNSTTGLQNISGTFIAIGTI